MLGGSSVAPRSSGSKPNNVNIDERQNRGNKTHRQNQQSGGPQFKLPPIGDVLSASINQSILNNTLMSSNNGTTRYDAAMSKIPIDVLNKIDALTERPFAKKKKQMPPPSTMATVGSPPSTAYLARNPMETSTIDGSSLDDIALRKALNEAFVADPDSYLGAIQEFVHRVTTSGSGIRHFLPKSIIPEEYFVYSTSPIYKGFKTTDDVSSHFRSSH
jgi:hypothetical protein